MTDSDALKFIRDEIRRQLQIILPGVSQNATGQTEDIANMYPGMDPITGRPTVHPYGFVSSAPVGTPQVTARMGEHPGNRLVLGHRDASRPVVPKGETILYDASGGRIHLKSDGIHIGSSAAAENAVLGKVFQSFMSSVLSLIAAHTHVGNLGSPTSAPINASSFTAKKSSPIDDSAILADHIFVEKGS